MARHQQTYDHRLRELVRQTGDLTIATGAGVPGSTASGWLRDPGRRTVTLDALSMEKQALQAEVLDYKVALRSSGRLHVSWCRPCRHSTTTWHRLVRERGWRRPGLRVHPAKPKTGIRSERPNGVWHIDTTIIHLIDGTKAYLHAVIDNYSRRILPWRIDSSFDTGNTVAILLEACKSSTACEPPMVLVHGGVENFNKNIDKLIGSGLLRRVLAQTELRFSNSMIEAWWLALKHQWIFLNTLDSVKTVEKLVGFYVTEHNELLAHSAFRGQTSDEVDFG